MIIPDLEGVLLLDEAARAAAGRDLGNIVSAAPRAVLKPASVEDIQRAVRFCAQHGIPISARGEGHTTQGQGLAAGGVVIDIRCLDTIHSITPDGLDADAGVVWRRVVAEAERVGLRAAGLTGYLKLTLGGTLSVGGVSSAQREGGLVDRVRAAEVVTGTGERLWCSATEHPDLFDSVLGGLGQTAIITRVRLDLLPAPRRVQTHLLRFSGAGEAIRAMRGLMTKDGVDGLMCAVLPPGSDSPATYQVHVDRFDPTTEWDLGADQVLEQGYLEHVSFFDNVIDGFRENDWDSTVKPWFDVFLPDESMESFTEAVIPSLTREEWSPTTVVLLIPHLAKSFTRPRFRVPGETEVVWLFDVLNDSTGAGPDFANRMLRRNRALWEHAKTLGAVQYPIGSLPFDTADWAHHYGATWAEVLATKRRYDPAGILTPGPAIRTVEGSR